MYNSTCLKLEYSVSFPHGPQHSASIFMTKQKRFTVQEKCYIVSSFQMFTSKKNRVGKIRLGLMTKFPDRKVPSKASIFRLVKKYETNFTVENLHKGILEGADQCEQERLSKRWNRFRRRTERFLMTG